MDKKCLTRDQALLLALMSSENRAAHALGRSNPSGLAAFVAGMNAKTHSLGLADTRFEDPAGLSSGNVASARDIARIVDAAYHYPRIRTCTTTLAATILGRRSPIEFHNTNHLVQSPRWQIGLSKTGFIEESGQCLVMQAQMAQRPLLIVLMDATGMLICGEDLGMIPAAVPAVLLERDESVPGEDYRITAGQKNSVYTVTVAGGTPQGVVNGVYGLLRALGYRFYLGSESAPAALPEELPGTVPIEGSPVFSVRGVLPWYNFFDSPTAWDPMDHRALVDQLIADSPVPRGASPAVISPHAGYEYAGPVMAAA